MNNPFKTLLGWIVLCLSIFSLSFGFVMTVNAAGSTLFVSNDGSGTDCSQANPCLPVQAMNDAVAGDTIYFKEGEYIDVVSDPYLLIDKAVSLIGGWDGAPTGEVVVDPDLYEVVINGGSTRSLFHVNDTSGTGDLITITGFKFQNGYNNPSGGAIYIINGRVDIVDNMFQENTAGSYGGAIYTGSSYDVHILDNSFVGNEVTWGGGSIYAMCSTTVLIEGNVFIGGAADYGTAIHSDSCNVNINANLFKDNPGTSTIDIYSYSIGSTISNNFLIRSDQYAIYLMGENTTRHEIVNNTIMNVRYGISPTSSFVNISNNIIAYTFSFSIFNSSGTMVGSNNLFYENGGNSYPLTNPVYEDPMFVDPSTDDYHLDKESPAVDAGAVVTLDEDYDGDERPIGDGYDIGADEVKSQFFGFLPLFMK
ncbi:MAG: DUF1565 domain-containing protein [Anaerolineaceae bacterium]|nr:DUF1565 domain-containing protein [Anaerolineaceae bacterium]